MGVVLGLVFFLPIAAITGGIAGALVNGGREDRPIWKNAVIGVVGWLFAWGIVAAFTGYESEELTLGAGLLALGASALFILMDEWWSRRKTASSSDSLSGNAQ